MLTVSALLLAALFAPNQALANPKPLWSYEKKDGIQNPESVYFDTGTDTFYVANIAGDGTKKDGVGWISKISRDGKNLQARWAEGLNAPKGMRAAKGILWVSDIDELIAIDLKTAKIKARHEAKGAKFLNDVAIADDGAVYVSDTLNDRIYRLRGEKMEIFMAGPELEAPNGLLLEGDILHVVGWGQGIKPDWSVKTPGKLYSIALKSKKISPVTEALGNLDGLERARDGGFLVSDWMAGKVLHISAGGKSKLVLQDAQGTADLGFDAKKGTLVVPGMQESRVRAYLLD